MVLGGQKLFITKMICVNWSVLEQNVNELKKKEKCVCGASGECRAVEKVCQFHGFIGYVFMRDRYGTVLILLGGEPSNFLTIICKIIWTFGII